ncbi:MAG: 3-hydroxyacyl-CoA dehydrogenase [Hymenobacteraceae bacterium]|nr:3-hydroxyacyl-CoA dehydrogenase [Hymenobacteraceae bacterium]
MHILVLEGGHIEEEFRQKFGPDHQITLWAETPLDPASAAEFEDDWETHYDEQQAALIAHLAGADVVFAFAGGADLPPLPPGKVLFVEATTQPLAGAYFGPGGARATPVYGFCGLPTLLNRPLLEVSVVMGGDEAPLREVCGQLGTEYRVVADRVGLATPRVLAMLVNEACYTLQEGTAEAADIDRAMQLGTNYPRGPLAWGDAIGPARVLAVLDAMWTDTHDGRYRACPLLRTRATLGEGLSA